MVVCTLIFAVISLFLTKSRAVPLSLIIGILLVVLFLKSSFNKYLNRKTWLIVSVAFILVLGSFSSISTLKGNYGTSTRIDYWKKGIELFFEKPIIGYGMGAFKQKYSEKNHDKLRSYYAHNIFVQSASETGLLGFSGLIILLITCLYQAYTFIKEQSRISVKLFHLSIWVGLICMLLNDFVDFDLQLPVAGLIFWTFMAFFSTNSKKGYKN
jgi:O-antigen ligase